MRPAPEHARDIDYAQFNYSKDMDALIRFIKSRWDGVSQLKPKGYDEFCKDYEDFKGTNDDEAMKKEERAFKSFDDGTASSFPFPIRTSLPQVAYDDICQGRRPHEVLFGALVAHGHARGELFGKRDAFKAAVIAVGHVMVCKFIDQFKAKGASEETLKALWEFSSKVTKFLDEMEKGMHTYNCKCDLCHMEPLKPLSPKEQKKIGKKIRKVMGKGQ